MSDKENLKDSLFKEITTETDVLDHKTEKDGEQE